MEARFVTEPVVAVTAAMRLEPRGIDVMINWLKSRAPSCLPEGVNERALSASARMAMLFPHDLTDANGRLLTDNELQVELAGRKCYNSFGLKAGRKSNREYIENTQAGDVPHASIAYHAKMTFFIAGVSRRVSHELIRNYVGADRDEEGSPSQESTRYVENAGFYVIPPKYLAAEREEGDGSPLAADRFMTECRSNYVAYLAAVMSDIEFFKHSHGGEKPKGIDYKRILEAASSLLMHSVETSFFWTTNPMALAKLFRERDHDAADAEFRRFAKVWKALCVATWPNLFPQSWMRAA